MNRFLSALAVAALLAWTAPAKAAVVYMCQGDVSGASTGARTIGGTGSAVPSATLYTLNSAGCAVILQADVGFFQSQGFTQQSSDNTILFTTGVATGTTNFVIGVIPANAYIRNILFSNAAAAAVTGGISIGTTANGADVVAAQACAANCLTFTTDALLLKRVFPATQPSAAQTLNAAAVTAWNNANVTITVVYAYF